MRGGSINFSNFKKENLNPKTIKRLLSYMKDYKFQCGLVIICILISSISSVASSLFMKTLIDGYIAPLLLEAVPNFAGLLKAITGMAVLYLCGVSAAFFYNRTMAVIAQGILKKIRDQMFSHIETLPISFFDTHTHGDIMSRFTNDADT
ncbi:MAG: ABC transporter transmembrane domain-containing protein, partial [Oscillospiraceae bacterium]